MVQIGDVVSLGGHERLTFTQLGPDLLEVAAEWDPTLDVPRGTPHAMFNAGAGPARATWQVRPPLRTAEMWARLDAITNGAGRMPTPAEGAQLLEEFAPEFRLVV